MNNQNVHDINDSENNTNRYETSKIYMLWTFDEFYYIGSTINELRYRLRDHKQAAKKHPDRKVYKYINEIGWENTEIKLLEEYPCSSLSELLQKENEYITCSLLDANCLNENAAHLTEEELLAKQATYRQEHRDKILEYKQQYRKENADKIAEYNKTYVEQNKEVVAARKQAYNQFNKEKIAAQTKAYAETHREQFRKYNRVYKEKHSDEIKQRRILDKEKLAEKGRTYYAENKEEVLKRNREYRDANKERLAERQKELQKLKGQPTPVTCEICNGSYQEYRKSRHESSKKHQDALIK